MLSFKMIPASNFIVMSLIKLGAAKRAEFGWAIARSMPQHRSFSSTAAESEDQHIDGDEVAKRRKSPIGAEYHELLHRSRGVNRLALGDFKNLCIKISDPNDVKYAKYAAELFQRKGQDFSEETNSHFIMACIRGGTPNVAVEHFAKSKHRLGAWTTNTSFNRLLEALLEQDTLPDCFPQVLDSLLIKGLYINETTVGLLQRVAEKYHTEGLQEAVQKAAASI